MAELRKEINLISKEIKCNAISPASGIQAVGIIESEELPFESPNAVKVNDAPPSQPPSDFEEEVKLMMCTDLQNEKPVSF